MQASLEQLRKFFRLEHANGYLNTAVIGGLVNILDYWEGAARNDQISETLIQEVQITLKSYASSTPVNRSDELKSLWEKIKQTYPDLGASRQPKRIETVAIPSGLSENIDVPAIAIASQIPDSPHLDVKPKIAKSAPPHTLSSNRAESHPINVPSKHPIALNASLTVLAGVGPKHASMLTRLGLNTLGDMLYNFPRRYDDYSTLKPIREVFYGQQVTVIGEVTLLSSRPMRGGSLIITEVIINDGTASLRLTWFNQPWIANRLKAGEMISVSGKIDQYLGRLVMNSPEWEPVEVDNLHTNRIVPIYPLTANVTQKWLRTLMHHVVSYWAPKLTDHIPDKIRKTTSLPDLGTALLQIHFPDSNEKLQEARQRLAFDEIFFLQMGVLRRRLEWRAVPGKVFEVTDDWLGAHLASLPFTLTKAQEKAIIEIRQDLKSGKPMNRLLQGDVGAGKTIVAALTAAMVCSSGAQAAIMAPTSILAEQHYQSFQNILASEKSELRTEEIRLLLGDTSPSDREEIYAGLSCGAIKILIGTHALLEEPVVFANLQFITIDEQHRFGVEQRAILRSKGNNPHLLVMTATPIPRSLALTVYGDLDLSVMDEIPPGRLPVATYILAPVDRERAYTVILGQIEIGHQAFIVYPLIEESEKSDQLAATQQYEKLKKEIFKNLRIGLLHGRLRPEEKETVMVDFRNKKYDILVSTTVVEVGVDIPNATVMVVEGANHFGLAQLHQLRGRVGRAGDQSYCLLIPDHEETMENERLQVMVETNNGFALAERDLQQRGPGEFLGNQQAGFTTPLKMASLSDVKLIENARTQAQALFEQDPDLKDPDNNLLAEAITRFWGGGKGDIS